VIHRRLQRRDPGQELRRSRVGVTLTFVLLGLGSGSLASRVPAIKDQLHLSAGSLGIALLGSALGSVLSTPVSGLVLTRWAPRRWIAVGLVPFTVVLPLATLAGSRWSLLAVLFAEGFGMGCVDVAMNTEATRVQALLGRRILTGIHASFSFGALAGAAIGAAAAAASIGFGTQFVVVGAVVLAAGWATLPLLPASPAAPTRKDAGAGRAWPRLRWPLVALAVVSFASLLGEGAANDWSAVYIHTSLGAPAALSALGYAAFSATMVAGRLSGDRLSTRWGPVRVARLAAVLGAAGLGIALVSATPAVAIAGFGLLGFGLAVPFPLAIGAASALGTTGPSVALVTSVGYLGLLCGPPVIGGLATATSLPVALGLPVALCVLIAVLAGHLRGGDPTRATDLAPATGAACTGS
jgi:MFS family permease